MFNRKSLLKLVAGEAAGGGDTGPPLAEPGRDAGPPESNQPAVVAPLVLDVSESMAPFAADLRRGVAEYYRLLDGDDLSAVTVLTKLVQVATEVELTPFRPAAGFVVPELRFGGRTSLGRGLVLTADAVEAELRRLAAAGRPLNRLAITVLTDGHPTDDPAEGVARLRALERRPEVSVFPVAAGEAAEGFLAALSSKARPARLRPAAGSFTALLRWLAGLHATYSRSRPGEAVELPPADEWRADR